MQSINDKLLFMMMILICASVLKQKSKKNIRTLSFSGNGIALAMPFLCPVLQAIKQGAGSILNDFEYYDKYK